ncbi:MAG: hypothetical protein EB075_07500 [Bacteroidetes bacterium]|nr:hypothetical protein [Bacteroidota bacterium]
MHNFYHGWSECDYDDTILVAVLGTTYQISHPAFKADHERRMALLVEEDRETRWDDRVPLDRKAFDLLYMDLLLVP